MVELVTGVDTVPVPIGRRLPEPTGPTALPVGKETVPIGPRPVPVLRGPRDPVPMGLTLKLEEKG